jgi:AcrR family transcriptional regulator
MDDQGPPKRCTPALDPLLRAVLAVVGEVGWKGAGAEAIVARAGLPLGALYSRYTGREECFAAAYEARAEPLAAAILDAGQGILDPAGCLEAALTELIAFTTSEPLLARAILAQVYVAGGAALVRHEQILRRLSDAVAGTRRESHPSRHDPPPMTAAFILGGIEEVVRRRVGERRPELLRGEMPALVAFATAPFPEDGDPQPG